MKILLMSALFVLYSNLVMSNDVKGNVIGTLATNKHLLEMWVVDGQSKYLVKDKSGKPLTKVLSEVELAKSYPSLGEIVKEGIADDASLGPAVRKVPGILED